MRVSLWLTSKDSDRSECLVWGCAHELARVLAAEYAGMGVSLRWRKVDSLVWCAVVRGDRLFIVKGGEQ